MDRLINICGGYLLKETIQTFNKAHGLNPRYRIFAYMKVLRVVGTKPQLKMITGKSGTCAEEKKYGTTKIKVTEEEEVQI